MVNLSLRFRQVAALSLTGALVALSLIFVSTRNSGYTVLAGHHGLHALNDTLSLPTLMSGPREQEEALEAVGALTRAALQASTWHFPALFRSGTAFAKFGGWWLSSVQCLPSCRRPDAWHLAAGRRVHTSPLLKPPTRLPFTPSRPPELSTSPSYLRCSCSPALPSPRPVADSTPLPPLAPLSADPFPSPPSRPPCRPPVQRASPPPL